MMLFELKDYELDIFFSEDDEGYIATTLEMPTISGFGETVEEAFSELQTAFEMAVEDYKLENDDMPEPLRKKKYSGQFSIRVPKDLHFEIAKAALLEQTSMNQMINYLLARGITRLYSKKTQGYL